MKRLATLLLALVAMSFAPGRHARGRTRSDRTGPPHRHGQRHDRGGPAHRDRHAGGRRGLQQRGDVRPAPDDERRHRDLREPRAGTVYRVRRVLRLREDRTASGARPCRRQPGDNRAGAGAFRGQRDGRSRPADSGIGSGVDVWLVLCAIRSRSCPTTRRSCGSSSRISPDRA